MGKKNCALSEEDIDRICKIYLAFEETEQSKIFPNEAFGYWKITVERPLRVEGIDAKRMYSAAEIKTLKESGRRSHDGAPVIKRILKPGVTADPLRGTFPVVIDGKDVVVEYEPDTELRDTEQVPILSNGGIEAFLEREVLPYAPDAWYSPKATKLGYEMSFARHFHKGKPLRSLETIAADIKVLQQQTDDLVAEIVGDRT